MIGQLLRFVGIASMGFLQVGCGSSNPTKITVGGKIYFQDCPLNGGMIVLIPEKERGNQGELVIGIVGPDGNYSLGSDSNEFINPGMYRITVASLPNKSPSSKNLTLFQEVPDRYRDPNRSELNVEIQAGNNRVDLYLDSY